MQHRAAIDALAAKADFLALSAFEIGLFGWMAVMQLALFHRLISPPTVPPSGS